MTQRARWSLAVLLAAAATTALTACAQTYETGENSLSSHLGTPLESFPGITDDIYTLSLTQDVRLGSLPRGANQVAKDESGWVVVGICADTSTIDPEQTRNVTLRVVASHFVDAATLESIKSGSMQDGVICGNASSIGPVLD
ncbi:hypothetical protein AB0N73_10655 [Microbacterium sp. NPDC089189]|uniref:hypothetical protein n=1 Tax=Microbacterium sp. NPDC089189 TaxID=3154972 RepID=UPI0034450A5A